MAALTQFDLLQWLVAKDRPLGERIVSMRSNQTKNSGPLIADDQRERQIIATLADMVRASSLPKHTPGVVGKPRSTPIPDDTTPATSLADVMDLDPEPESEETIRERIAAAAERSRELRAGVPTPTPPPAIAAIQEAGRLKLEQQRARAQHMRDAKLAKKAQ